MPDETCRQIVGTTFPAPHQRPHFRSNCSGSPRSQSPQLEHLTAMSHPPHERFQHQPPTHPMKLPARFLPLVLLVLAALCTPLHAADAKPNIILIMADDFGYECVTANGGQSYQTPHLDRLAATGDALRALPCAAALHADARAADDRALQRAELSQLRHAACARRRPSRTCSRRPATPRASAASGSSGASRIRRSISASTNRCLWQHTRRPPRYANPGLEHNGVEKDFTKGEYGPKLVNDFALDFVTRHKDAAVLPLLPDDPHARPVPAHARQRGLGPDSAAARTSRRT